MEFRLAVQNDTDSIALLHAASWQRTYRSMMPDEFLDNAAVSNRLTVWRERMRGSQADRFTYLALDRGRLVGFICAFGSEDADWGSYIDNLHVDVGYKRRGVGIGLMRGAARWLREHHARSGVYLWVMEANASARRFYEYLGARNRETMMKSDPGGGSAPNCRYTWDSPEALFRATEP